MDWFRHLFQRVDDSRDAVESGLAFFERFDEKLSPNLRALRLTMTIADYLVSMGVAVNDVVGMSLDITDTYCKRPVQVDISSTLLMFSQDRGDDREPLTLIRHAQPRDTNNMLVQSLQELVDKIRGKHFTLEQAEKALNQLLEKPQRYPFWLRALGSGLVSAGVGALLTGSLLIIVITFIIGALVSLLLFFLGKQQIPSFFSQVFAAVLITLTAGGVYWLSKHSGLLIFSGINPSLIVIGGIIMLVAGLAIVGAVQDAIDEFYVTANARLLRVGMMTAGIVVGVLVGLYIMRQLGEPLAIDTEYPLLQIVSWQYAGAFAIAAGFALSMQARWPGVILSGLMGLLGWYMFVVSTLSLNLAIFAASGFAAIVVGLAGSLISRFSRIPSTALITAGIIPLVPGLTMFNGLLEIAQGTKSSASLIDGLLTLSSAAAIAIAIAAGASFGNMLARPIRRTLVRARNVLPSRQYENDSPRIEPENTTEGTTTAQ